MNRAKAQNAPAVTSTQIALAFFTAVAITLIAFAARADQVTTYAPSGVAIHGTDPVAYFTMAKPVAGKDAHTAQHDGVTWKFSSAENKAKFVANPAKYAPQYGGYCATGASFGYKVSTAPEQWKIVAGKLYLNNGPGAQSRFLDDIPGTIKKADTNWPTIKNNK